MDVQTQLKNCSDLLALLQSLDPALYDHTVFRACRTTGRCCAMGHAARAGIGGLRIGTAWTPWLVDHPQLMVDEVADLVFGEHAWVEVFNVEALNRRLSVEDRGGFVAFDWHLDGEPASEDAVYARQRGEAALAAVIEALAEHMVTLS